MRYFCIFLYVLFVSCELKNNDDNVVQNKPDSLDKNFTLYNIYEDSVPNDFINNVTEIINNYGYVMNLKAKDKAYISFLHFVEKEAKFNFQSCLDSIIGLHFEKRIIHDSAFKHLNIKVIYFKNISCAKEFNNKVDSLRLLARTKGQNFEWFKSPCFNLINENKVLHFSTISVSDFDKMKFFEEQLRKQLYEKG